jgi:uncharacterized protein (TIGR03435 family)
LELFTIRLGNIVNRLVVDLSHLTGTFDLDVEYRPDFQTAGPFPIPLDGASIFTALREQLALRLESQRGSIDVLVIGHVEIARVRPDVDEVEESCSGSGAKRVSPGANGNDG